MPTLVLHLEYAEAYHEWTRHCRLLTFPPIHLFDMERHRNENLSFGRRQSDTNSHTFITRPTLRDITTPTRMDWNIWFNYVCDACVEQKFFFIELSINCLIRPSAFTEIHVCLNNLWADFFDSLADAIKSWLNKIEAFLHSLFLISNHCGINFSQRILKSSLKTIAMPVILFH